MDAPLTPPIAVLRVGYVPGVQPDKWLTRWRERFRGTGVRAEVDDDPLSRLARVAGAVGVAGADDEGPGPFDVAFVREPDDAPRSAPAGVLRIPLYTETMAVLAARGHEVTAFETVPVDDLDGERWLDPVDPIATPLDDVRAAVELVAAGAGLLVLPQPYARVLSRRDVVAREVTGIPATRIGVAWAVEREGENAIDDFLGIVRGRTANSSRSSTSTEAVTPERAARTPRGGPRGRGRGARRR